MLYKNCTVNRIGYALIVMLKPSDDSHPADLTYRKPHQLERDLMNGLFFFYRW